MPKHLGRLLGGMVGARSGRLDRGQLWGRRQSVGGRLGRGPGILPEQGGLLLFPSYGFHQHLPHSELQPSLRNSKRLL